MRFCIPLRHLNDAAKSPQNGLCSAVLGLFVSKQKCVAFILQHIAMVYATTLVKFANLQRCFLVHMKATENLWRCSYCLPTLEKISCIYPITLEENAFLKHYHTNTA